MKDIFVACFDGLKGVPEAIEPVFPETQVQLCIVHMGQHSQNYVSWKQRNEIATDLKAIYTTNAIESVNMSLRKVMKTGRRSPMTSR